MNHTIRVLVSVLLTIVAVSCSSQNTSENSIVNVGIESARELVDREGAVVVLDVRTPEEYAIGHIEGALNINIAGTDFAEKVSQLDRDKSYLVHCAANVENGRTARSMDIMSGLGFGKLLNMEGGFIAWEKSGNPVVRNNP